MNRICKMAGSVLLCGVILTAALSAEGDTGSSYSTASDPLVTLSYVNDTLKAQLKTEILAELGDSFKAEIASDVAAGLSGGEAITLPAGDAAFEVVYMTAGQTLLATDACEIVLRSGSADAVVNGEENRAAGIGLSDMTAGAEITADRAISTNHYLLIPRGDGRGLVVTSGEAYLMVRGGYEIVG